MRTIIHLSDIHFGRVDESLIRPLIEVVNRIDPHVVAVSGDLTQRARSYQFQQARDFLDQLPNPQIVVPGNHDVPLYDVYSRFFSPLRKYRQFITTDMRPFHRDDEIAVLGLNTARSLTIKGGRINETQVAWMREMLCDLDTRVLKILVTHHPFDLPEGHDERDLVGRARMAMEQFATCGVDMLLAGHLHLSHTTHSAIRYNIEGHSALMVQAGTATSTRGRGEANSFNVIRADGPRVTVERFEWQPTSKAFTVVSFEHFEQVPGGWNRI